jgi:hypothetical protein
LKLFGLGIDCSGYIYNVLLAGFKSFSMENQFIQSLAWKEKDKTGVSKASVDVFSETASTILTDLSSLSDLDLLLLKDENGSYTHIAMMLKDEWSIKILNRSLILFQNGVRIDGMR